VTRYTYTLNNQLSQKTTFNSDGDSTIEYYSHPLDYVNAMPGNTLSNAVISLKNKNIVAPVIEQYLKKWTSSGTLIGSIRAQLNSYSPINNLPDTVWNTEFLQPSTTFSPIDKFNTALTKDGAYKAQLIFDKYDASGNPVLQHKVNDYKHVYLWDYLSFYPICEAVNADSVDIAYTSFEADGKGNWIIGAGAVQTTGGITGSNYYVLSSGATIARSGLNTSQKYTVTYWSKAGPLSISGAMAVAGPVKNGWTFYQHNLASGVSSVSLSGTGISIDELRLYPTNAQMTTFTYIPLAGRSSVCSINNIITYYEYDGLQRLLRIRDMDGNIIKQYEYQYQLSTQ